MTFNKLVQKSPALFAFITSVAISIITFTIIMYVTFILIIQIFPSTEVVLLDGTTRRVQPSGQYFTSIALGTITAISIFLYSIVAIYKRFKNLKL